MLAALLLNLGAGPTPPPPTAAPARFGGGPFWKRYGYHGYGIDEDEEEEASPEPEAVFPAPAVAAIERAVFAIRDAPKPEPLVYDASGAFSRAMREIRSDLAATRLQRMWEREVRRVLKEQVEAEDEAMLILAITEL